MPTRRIGLRVVHAALGAALAVALAGCDMGARVVSNGFAPGDDFSYMAQAKRGGGTTFGLISGAVSSDGSIAGELQVVRVEGGAVSKETAELAGTANEDGTAVFRGIGPDGADVTATLEEERAVMITDKEPGVPATEWQRASLPAFNGAVQNASQG
ncbi:hypothetical protein [Myceligenerans crystallogenes]|uniref:hypothetical protein n=1 Tax=Myceligenerans crystallogenes TaxID=316335 RepID=UPI0031D07859